MSSAAKAQALQETLALFDQHKPVIVAKLRERAMQVYLREARPVSTNDVRSVLGELGYVGDARILAAAFPKGEWLSVGWTTTNSVAANTRAIRTFIPRDPEQRVPAHRVMP